MKRYRSILVCVKSTDRAAGTLAYLGEVCRAAQTQQVHLLHVKAGDEGVAQLTVEDLGKLAADHLEGHGSEKIVTKVIDGAPLIEILRYALDQEIDLIVAGRQAGGAQEAGHEAALVRRVTRKSSCSVLALPENTPAGIRRIVVPARDSECSASALETACGIAAAVGAKVCCLNVFQVPPGYKCEGSTLDEHTELMRQLAQKECQSLFGRVDMQGVEVEVQCVPDLYGRQVSIIREESQNQQADLIVIGSRGRTGAAGVLLGKVTEQLIRKSAVPVLAVKKKGECIGILRALLELA